MDRCNCCDKDTSDETTITCTANEGIMFPDGSLLPPVVYGVTPGFDDEIAERQRCSGCGVKLAGFHHPGCKMERCPRCGDSIISCGCLPDPVDPSARLTIDFEIGPNGRMVGSDSIVNVDIEKDGRYSISTSTTVDGTPDGLDEHTGRTSVGYALARAFRGRQSASGPLSRVSLGGGSGAVLYFEGNSVGEPINPPALLMLMRQLGILDRATHIELMRRHRARAMNLTRPQPREGERQCRTRN